MPQTATSSRFPLAAVEPLLLGLICLGAIAVLSLPAARGASITFGWMPMWLLGLPTASLATVRMLCGLRAREAEALIRPARRRLPGTASAGCRGTMARRRMRRLRAA